MFPISFSKRKAKKLFKITGGLGLIDNDHFPITSGLTALQNSNKVQENIIKSSSTNINGNAPKELLNQVIHSGISEHTSKGDTGNTILSDNEKLCEVKPSATKEVKDTFTSPFPDLVVLYDPFKDYDGITLINHCLKEFNNYGQLCTEFIPIKKDFKLHVVYNGKVLAEGQGPTKKKAELAAGAKLLQMLRCTNYVIEPKSSYFPKRDLPDHVRNVDSSQKHIYKVVCLKKPCDPNVPFELSGAVDYVPSENQLWQYVRNHVESGPTIDLYVINVDRKSGLQRVGQICQNKNVYSRKIVGCSDKAVAVFCNESIQHIYQELKECGGENIKYRLVPPGCNIRCSENVANQEEDDFDSQSAVDILSNDKELIEIPQWIVENLILMDFFKDNNSLESSYHIIRISVSYCPVFVGFKLEIKFDKNTSMYLAEALIDGKMVGRAKSFIMAEAKKSAADNALENLKNSCIYIKAKMSYFQQFPPVLEDNNPINKNNVFRVVDHRKGTTDQDIGNVLLEFKDSAFQDLFFRQNFSVADRKLVISMARDMKLLVRHVENDSICVYKKIHPIEIYEMLMKTGENEKYKLIIPPEKSSKLTKKNKLGPLRSKELPAESQINFETQSVVPPLQVKVESNPSETCQTVTSGGNEIDRLKYNPLENGKDEYWQRSDGLNQGWQSGSNKRSYAEGPGSCEEQMSTCSQLSNNNQRTFEPRHSFDGE